MRWEPLGSWGTTVGPVVRHDMAATDKDKVMKKFTDRLQLRFDNVQRAWHHIRRTVPADGVISANQFYRMIDQVFSIGMSEKEIHEMIRILDKDKNGVIDFNEFQVRYQPSYEGVLALVCLSCQCIQPRFLCCRHRGMRKRERSCLQEVVVPCLRPDIVPAEHCTGMELCNLGFPACYVSLLSEKWPRAHSTTASQQVNQQEFATIRTGLSAEAISCVARAHL